MAKDFSIKDLIHSISEQLLQSEDERLRDNRPAIFEVDTLQLDISFVATESRGVKGGLDLRIVQAGLDKTYADQAVQRISLGLRRVSAKSDEFDRFDEETPLRPRRTFGEKGAQ
jgi:hypothetical protein